MNRHHLNNPNRQAGHVMIRVLIHVDELRIKEPASIHQRCQVGSHLFRNVAKEKVAKQLHSNCVGVMRVANFTG